MSIDDQCSLIDGRGCWFYSEGMTEMPFKRARSPQAKARRAGDLLKAAAAILDQQGVEEVTLTRIAARAGVVKSNVYRYFESREEILLRVLLSDLALMLDALEQTVQGPLSPRRTAELLATGFASKARVCLLLTDLAPTLERNIGSETLRELKRMFLQALDRATAVLHCAQPEIPVLGCERIVMAINALVAGLWPMTHPGPVLERVQSEAEFARLRSEFQEALTQSIHALLLGAEAYRS